MIRSLFHQIHKNLYLFKTVNTNNGIFLTFILFVLNKDKIDNKYCIIFDWLCLYLQISDTTMPKVDKKKRKDDSSTPSTSDSDSGPEDVRQFNYYVLFV